MLQSYEKYIIFWRLTIKNVYAKGIVYVFLTLGHRCNLFILGTFAKNFIINFLRRYEEKEIRECCEVFFVGVVYVVGDNGVCSG